MYQNILIVDDEQHVTEAMLALLKSQADLECEVFGANSAEEALAIAGQERIDLMISDIHMPDVSGIDLLRIMKQKWPTCQVVMLTGFSDFSNIYDAFQLKAAGFLLKTESDEQIISKVKEVLRQNEERLNQQKLLRSQQEARSDQRLWEAVSKADGDQSRVLAALKAQPAQPVILCLCDDLQGRASELDTLIRFYMSERMSVISYCDVPFDGRALWLFQDEAQEATPALVSNMMETVQNSFRTSTNGEFSCVIAAAGEANLHETFALLMEALGGNRGDGGSISILNALAPEHKSADYTIRFVKKYIAEHIADDINIPMLASITGYNADYLSRTFRKNTGSTIGAYIADVRLTYVKQIMRENVISLDELYQKVGFSSRAYFNRFIKRATGMSPRALRLAVMGSEESEE